MVITGLSSEGLESKTRISSMLAALRTRLGDSLAFATLVCSGGALGVGVLIFGTARASLVVKRTVILCARWRSLDETELLILEVTLP